MRLLNAFVAAGALSFRSITTTSFSKPRAVYRPFTAQLRRLAGLHSEDSRLLNARHDEYTERGGSKESHKDSNSDDPPQQDDSIPWYLQVEPPDQETTKSLLQRQRLPDLPPDPPPLLQPMLEHIFLELGIDDLMLFDLRKVDPPPALGANLIMIIGTARSEKHLHVSADLFCRYMKTTHQIAPYADGLLGRGELKLKLKRKARRARILSRVGSTETSNVDDGIRTGWICVTVGNIENGGSTEEAIKLPDDFVGFGEVESGANIVIQMLTQEKREELDLEDLWGKTLRRHERKQDRISQGVDGPDPQDEVGLDQLHDEGQTADFSPMAPSSYSMNPNPVLSRIHHSHNGALQGVRSFSTFVRRYHDAAAISGPESIAAPYHPEANRVAGNNIEDDFLVALPIEYEEELQRTSKASAETFKLKAHLEFAHSLSPEDARTILGKGARDTISTPFLQSFYSSIPLFPTAEQWRTRASLLILGIQIGAPRYTKQSLTNLFREIQTSLITIPAPLYTETISTLLQPTPPSSPSQPPHISPSSISSAVSILDDMLFRGHPLPLLSPTNDDIISLLSLAIIHASPQLDPSALSRLTPLLPHPPPTSLEIAKLRACTPHRNFQTMWAIWRSFLASMRSRPPAVYVAMLEAVAGTGHAGRCAEVLWEVVASMEREEPPVSLENVGEETRTAVFEAVMMCLRVVAPELGRSKGFMGGRDGGREWERLWRVCERVGMEQGRWAREMDDD